MNEQTVQHSITRAHVWVATMVTVAALNGPVWILLAAGFISAAHVVIALYASAREGEK